MKKMKGQDLECWLAKNERLNEGVELKRGMRIKDRWGSTGVVVKIIPHNPENPIEDHGTIYVWQENEYEHGADNCEHYAENNWRREMRILED